MMGGKQKVDNFTNILFEAFMSKDPQSAKKTDNLTMFFALLGYVHVKTEQKMLVKLTQGQQFNYSFKETSEGIGLSFLTRTLPLRLVDLNVRKYKCS